MHDCVFCDYENKVDGFVVINETPRVICVTPLQPVVPGHRILFLEKHFAQAHEDPHGYADLMQTVAAWADDEGDYNIIQSNGRAATQTVDHVHVHYVPRHADDGLILPWTFQFQQRDRQCSYIGVHGPHTAGQMVSVGYQCPGVQVGHGPAVQRRAN